MCRTFRCKHCGESQRLNPRLKVKQKYCSKETCKNARKRDWANHQYAGDPIFRENSKQRQKRWRQNHSADQYQNRYRGSHPEYTDRNRQLQQSRNITRPSTFSIHYNKTLRFDSPLQGRSDRGGKRTTFSF